MSVSLDTSFLVALANRQKQPCPEFGDPSTAPDSSRRSAGPDINGIAPGCRICLSTEPILIQPCKCSGTLSYTHLACLQAWVEQRGSMSCELCQCPYKEQYAPSLQPLAAAAAAKHQALHVIHANVQQPTTQQRQWDVWKVSLLWVSLLQVLIMHSS